MVTTILSQQIANTGITYGHILVAIAMILVVVFMKIKNVSFSKNKYERSSLNELFEPELKNLANEVGALAEREIFYGYRKIGVADKIYDYTMFLKSEVVKNLDNEDIKNLDKKYANFSMMGKDFLIGKNNDELIETAKDDDDLNDIKVSVIMKREDNFMHNFINKFFNGVPAYFMDILIVPERFIIEQGGERIQVDKDANPVKYAGMTVFMSVETDAFFRGFEMKKKTELITEEDLNNIMRVSVFNNNQASHLMGVRFKNDEESKKWESKDQMDADSV